MKSPTMNLLLSILSLSAVVCDAQRLRKHNSNLVILGGDKLNDSQRTRNRKLELYDEDSTFIRTLEETMSIPPVSEPTEAPRPSFESVSHGLCASFAVHAGTTITFDGVMSTIHGGDIGVSPGTSITGSYTFDNGQVELNSSDFAALVTDAHASAMEVRVDATAMPIEIGGLTFTPGTHRSSSAINFAYGTVVTLDGLHQPNPVFLFQAESTLVTAADTHFILKNGAKAENVYWALGTAATLGANSIVVGSILAGTAITFGTNSELRGCALAQSAVTFESDGSIQLNHYIEDDILILR
jgi:hypothetical protein